MGQEPYDNLFSKISDTVCSQLDGSVSPTQDAMGKARFLAAITQRPNFRGMWLRFGLAVATVAVLCGGVFLSVRPSPISFTVKGALLSDGNYVSCAEASTNAEILFSEGSVVTLHPGAKGRLSAIDPHGATLVVESGQAGLNVHHRGDTAWRVHAGPYIVSVTGTKFDVRWTPSTEVFEVKMHEGSVIVRGPLTEQGIGLSGGQHLILRQGSSEFLVDSAELDRGDTANPVASVQAINGAPPAPVASSNDLSPAPNPSAFPADSRSWTQRVASGDFQGVVRAAEARGLSTALSSASLSDLVALGDAARYSGKQALAQQCLSSIRARFASSSDAKNAAFLLGRMADDKGSQSSALLWYDRYLMEAPNGTFAAEALGRKLVAQSRGSNSELAQSTAREYLRRFPRGTHAPIAEKILRTP